MTPDINGLYYLASPYSHTDKEVTNHRIHLFCQVDSKLTEQGLMTVSPLSKHMLLERGAPLPSDWAYWERYGKTLLDRCTGILIILMDGLYDSVGVRGELAHALRNGLPVYFVDLSGSVLDRKLRAHQELISRILHAG